MLYLECAWIVLLVRAMKHLVWFLLMNLHNRTGSGRFIFALVFLLIYLGSRIAMPFQLIPDTALGIWPLSGIYLALAIALNFKSWPIIFVFNVLAFLYSAGELADPATITIAGICSIFQAGMGAWLVKRFAFYPGLLTSIRQIIGFFVVSAVLPSVMPASVWTFWLYHIQVIELSRAWPFFFLFWLSTCSSIAVFTPLSFLILERKNTVWKRRTFSITIPLLVLLSIVFSCNWYIQTKEQERLQRQIEEQAAGIKNNLQNVFNQQMDVLGLYKTMLIQQQPVTDTFFQSFLQSSRVRYPAIESIRSFKAQRQNNEIVYRDGEVSIVNAGLNAVGLSDLASGNEIFRIENGVIKAFLPNIASGPGSCNCLQSIVAGEFSVEELVHQAIMAAQARETSVTLQKANNIIYQSSQSRKALKLKHFSYAELFSLARDVVLLTVTPDDEALNARYYWFFWILMAGSLFLTGFVSLGLLVLTGNTETVREQVDKRTEDLALINRRLKASEQQFRNLVQAQSAIVWRVDPVSLRFMFVSDEAEVMLGYPVQSWLDDPLFWQSHIHEDDRERAIAYCLQKTRQRVDHDFEYRMVAVDGRVVWLRDFVNLIIEDNELKEMVGFMIDVTRQKETEEQLRLAAITFDCLQSVMITDLNSNILQVNQAFTEITGYSKEDVIGKRPSLLKSGKHDENFYNRLWQQLITAGRFEGEIWNKRKDDRIYPEWKTITAVKNPKGETTHYVSVGTDITEKKNAESKIYNMAFYDPLTALPNRRLLLDRFEQELTVARRHKQYGAVIFFDLDYFKLLNDSLGHHVGDELLVQVANRLISVIRDEDTPARLGGDEFVVLLHANWSSLAAAADQVFVIAEKIRQALNKTFQLGVHEHSISSSMGIALFPDSQEHPEAILQQADTAMYRSKESGRNAVNFFHPSMQEKADLRLKLEKDLRTAYENDQFVLYFQPQFDIDQNIFGVEALIRWRRGDQFLSPDSFIPVAEESSCIEFIGHWVLHAACKQMQDWRILGFQLPRMSINVSLRQFKQHNFVEQLRQTLLDYAVEPRHIGIELTESAINEDMNSAVSKIAALKKLGVAVAIDDFGMGYSSLARLKQLPIDEIKIDKSFVADILIDPNDTVVVNAIIGIGKNLGLRTIAEGVESKEQLEVLKKQGCQAFQGYYFSKPLEPENLANRFLSHNLTRQPTINS